MGGFFREVFQTENEVPECCTWVHLLHETLTDEEATETSLTQTAYHPGLADARLADQKRSEGSIQMAYCLLHVKGDVETVLHIGMEGAQRTVVDPKHVGNAVF